MRVQDLRGKKPLFLAALLFGSFSCSSSSSDTTTSTNLNGVVVEFPNLNKLANVTVKAGDQTATTDANGKYGLNMPLNTPFVFTAGDADHITYVSQEMVMNGPYDQPATFLTPKASLPLLTGPITDLDQTLGVMSVVLVKTGSCQDEGGATIAVAPAAAKVIYGNSGGIPDPTVTNYMSAQYAIIYNVPLSTEMTFTVTHPSCHQVAFPYTDSSTTPAPGAVTFTGKGLSTPTPLSGNAVTYVFIYLQ